MKKTVLVEIIEDEKSLNKGLALALKKAGIETISAFDGEEGLNLALEHHPDLILLDIFMPKMDGKEMLKLLRNDEWGRDVPVLVLTNFMDSENVVAAMESGVIHYLIKSDWSIHAVVDRIKQTIGSTKK